MQETEQITDLFEFYTSFFFVLSSGRSISLAFDDITHISKCADEVIIYTIDQNYSTRHSLKDIFEVLPDHQFFRINRVHIIAIAFISHIYKNRVVVNGHYLLIASDYRIRFYTALKRLVNDHYDFMLLTDQNLPGLS
jgi:two-component system LytT family response regulator